MKKTALSLFTMLLAAVFALPRAAQADTISFVLTNPTQSAAAGSTLFFDATVSAPSTNSGPVSLDSDQWTIAGPFVIDDSGFFTNFPLFLDPNTGASGTLFSIFVPLGTPAGLYTGSSFQIFFPDVTGLESSVSQNFAIQVTAPSAVPEPGTWVLLITGAGVLAGVVYSRRRSGVYASAA